jgi:psp operon transcriptional activator
LQPYFNFVVLFQHVNCLTRESGYGRYNLVAVFLTTHRQAKGWIMLINQGQAGGGELPEALGQSESFLEFQEQISKVAPVERPVLILGERGTGKELAASRIHYLSKRWQRPLVTLNCAALTPSLIGSELFGYEKGAFTGASSRQAGRFEMASGGTFFLDEIGNIPMEVQEKILRVVEYGRFERVGSSSSIEVDVRIVAATNADLRRMAATGSFKQDLLDRLSFEVLFVPPLRERREDILFLADHFAARMAFELGFEHAPRFSSSASRRLLSYEWPGNIRELKNVVERAVYTSMPDIIKDVCFDPFTHPFALGLEQKEYKTPEHGSAVKDAAIRPDKGPAAEKETGLSAMIDGRPFKEALLNVEAYLIEAAMKSCRYNQKDAARALGLTYDQFRGVKKKHDAAGAKG